MNWMQNLASGCEIMGFMCGAGLYAYRGWRRYGRRRAKAVKPGE